MDVKSAIYEMTVMHERRKPIVRRFEHRMFMFYLDLDEIDDLSKRMWLFGHNKRRVYDYRGSDHIGDIRHLLLEKGIDEQVKRIRLLTNARTFGYVFNPVSFYFCFDANEKPIATVVEIGNTFGEQKYFYLGSEHLQMRAFKGQQVKYYYISPFTDLDNVLDFDIQVPDQQLQIGIDVLKNGDRFFFSSMLGERRALTDKDLLWMTIKCPFVTLKVIFLIHWHAAILHFVRRVRFHFKEEHPQDQRDIGKKVEVKAS